jgi:hypothetical protein
MPTLLKPEPYHVKEISKQRQGMSFVYLHAHEAEAIEIDGGAHGKSRD